MEYRSNMDDATKKLIEMANDKGGTDNVSVILITLHEAFSDEVGLPPGASQEIENNEVDQQSDESKE
jgi:serine/threonine protein phosphatase PrpC